MDVKLTSDELTVLLEALEEYRMRLSPQQHPTRSALVEALRYRLGVELNRRAG